ncbi:MAG: ATP-binding protein, partial [Lachnospiraceae bacterium]|nr:ATP-binding protein [Lachnospiraceae bacterium]
EKNLAMIFEEASHSNVILFFDEADALFSKRTEVGDSNDKYANAETAYLLQKIEEYRGISILATNFYNNFDQAFVRRITYAVHLESPNEEERLALWLNILPPETPREKNIDFKFFADQFELSGSNIKAILYSASFMAGAEGVSLGPKHIVKAMKFEFEKLGRMIDGSQFGKYAVFLYR